MMKIKERRIKLDKGKQRELIAIMANKLGSVKKLSKELSVPYSTLKGYFEEVRLLPENLFNKITDYLGINKNRLNMRYLDSNWGSVLGGKKGMAQLERKYPKKILRWRKEAINKAIITGTHYGYSNIKKIKTPFLNKKLAEFIGIYLGDGTMTKHQLRIVGDSRFDKLYFDYISKLVSELFGLKTSVLKQKNTNTSLLVIYSKNLCDFLNKNFNLKPGDKIRNRNIIPKKVLHNRDLSKACLRGLIDTDGSVSRRGRNGSQFCIQFTSHNKELLKQVNMIGRNLKIFTFSDKTGAGTNKWENIVRYFQIVGSSNPKHITRFLLRKDGKNIYRNDLSYYLEQEKYKTLNLPFTLKGV